MVVHLGIILLPMYVFMHLLVNWLMTKSLLFKPCLGIIKVGIVVRETKVVGILLI
nr:MAG TPA: hypothetical protein [Caudoviricetes sp.]